MNIVFELTGSPKYIFDNATKEVKQECSDVWFSGVLKDYITISSHSEEMMVVVFKPGAGYPLLHTPAFLFTDKVVPAQEVFGEAVLKLHKKLKLLDGPEQKFDEIEKWLKNRLKKDDLYTDIIQFALEQIENSPTEMSIGEITAKTGYSPKQFIQIFKKYVGITPKQFHRIKRFNEILTAVENDEKISWTIIAADCGYYDQAHFIKDFQSFSGLNPSRYLSDIGEFPNYFPVK
ncbi:AraC family transcriptional regulator [Muricauda sp. CAU 1633]|nr:AraC family transcriptional regulator [Muricauda sp. CAU 1633]MBO0321544.1 AraC family transcriptional regulator [Muricauda sp. CAU 1633]